MLSFVLFGCLGLVLLCGFAGYVFAFWLGCFCVVFVYLERSCCLVSCCVTAKLAGWLWVVWVWGLCGCEGF